MGLLGKWFGGDKGSTLPGSAAKPEDVSVLSAQANHCIDEGQFETAAQNLERIKQLQPERIPPRVNLAYCLLNLGRSLQAKTELEECLAIDPKNVDALYMISGVLTEEGRWADVANHLKTLLQTNPDFGLAYADLARALFNLKQFDDAKIVCHEGLKRLPGDTALYLGLGKIHFAKSDWQSALTCFERVLNVESEHSEALQNKALVWEQLGQTNQALELIEKIHKTLPQNPSSLGVYARLLVKNGRRDEGLAVLSQGLTLYPFNSDLLLSAALLHEFSGHHNEALTSLSKLLVHEPANTAALELKSSILISMRSYGPALESAESAVAINSKLFGAWNKMGIALVMTKQYVQAEQALKQALAIYPEYVDAWNNLGGLNKETGNVVEAVRCYGKAVELNPYFADAHGNRLFCMAYDSATDPHQYIDQAKKSDLLLNSEKVQFSQWLTGPAGSVCNGKLRVGFVSGDFLKHPVGFFLETTLKHLDPEKLELFGYSTVAYEDELTQRIKPKFSQWRSIVGLPDHTAAQQIHQDGLHLLIDLSGHSAGNRLGVFAFKPAPIQLAWLGYFASTGMASMDYIFVDPHGVSPHEQDCYSEKLCFLPETRLCFTPPTSKPVTPLPASGKGYVTLACFQDLTKVNDGVLTCWAKIMKRLPQARLRLMSKQTADPALRAELQTRLLAAGLPDSRIEVQASLRYEAYLDSYSHVDFMLDTFPYPGGTTTCEALWMGVPTVTVNGNTLLSRQGAGMMKCVGLNDWVANSQEEYIELAIRKAAAINEMAELRAGMRQRVSQTALFDGQLFAAHLTQAFGSMWRGEV
jgi:protein O-GlcNAc transferase